MQKKKLWLILALLIVILLGFLVWLAPSATIGSNTAASVAAESQQTTHLAITSHAALSQSAQPFASPSQQDTEINCQIRLDQSQHLVVNERTRNCFEYFITQFGEKQIEQIKQDFNLYAEQNYQQPALSQMIDLWNRYLDYRVQLGNLQEPNLNKQDPEYYRKVFALIKNLRTEFFSNYEIDGLFGTENIYHEYTLNRMSVMADASLNEGQKAQKLKALFAQLPEDWQASLEQLSQLEDLRKLTSDIKARGGSAEEIHQMRINLVGAEATQRLEQLDQERSQWQNRVTQYLMQRDQILNSQMSNSAQQQAIQQLRQQQFKNPQEQLRLGTFETTHDSGGKLPFAE